TSATSTTARSSALRSELTNDCNDAGNRGTGVRDGAAGFRSPHRMRPFHDSSASTATYANGRLAPGLGPGARPQGRSEGRRQADRIGHARLVPVHVHLVATGLLVLAEVGFQQVAGAEAQRHPGPAEVEVLPEHEVQRGAGAFHVIRLAGTAARA